MENIRELFFFFILITINNKYSKICLIMFKQILIIKNEFKNTIILIFTNLS